MADYPAWLTNTTNEVTASIERCAGGDVWLNLAADRVKVGITENLHEAEILVAREVINLSRSEWKADLQALRTLLNDPRIVALLDA